MNIAPIHDVPRQACVYILRSVPQPNRYYTGLTSNLSERLRTHNDGLSRHTSSGCPWRVVVSLTFEDEGAAKRFEQYLKSWSGRAFAVRHFRLHSAQTGNGPDDSAFDCDRRDH